jgi:hypothetical protein
MSQNNPDKPEEKPVAEPEVQADAAVEPEKEFSGEEPKQEEKKPEPIKEEVREEKPAAPPTPTPAPAPAAPEKPKKHWGLRIALVVIVALIIIAAVGVLTFTFVPTGAAQSTSFNHQNTLNILVPNAVPVDILGSKFTFTQLGDNVVIAIDGKGGQTLANGDSRDLVQGHGMVKMYGKPIIETDYSINLTYRGILNGKHNFLLTIKSTSNIPSFIIPFLLPKDVTVI